MTRSVWKGPFSEIKNRFFGVEKEKTAGKVSKKAPSMETFVWSRQSMILPQHVGSSYGIHNGKGWISVKVSEEMIGHKFGEFATTRKKPTHKTNKKKQISSRK